MGYEEPGKDFDGVRGKGFFYLGRMIEEKGGGRMLRVLLQHSWGGGKMGSAESL